eukprot:4560078-Pyramimonas_sp.AAC.1
MAGTTTVRLLFLNPLALSELSRRSCLQTRGSAGKLAWRAPEGQRATLPRLPARVGARCLGSFARPLGHVREASGARSKGK